MTALSASRCFDSGDREVAAVPLTGAETARERAALYSLLTTLFRTEPSRETLLSLRNPALRDAMSQAGMSLDEAFFTEDIDVLADTVAVDFVDLFLLPGTLISPHESVQIKGGSGLLRGPETALVREYYEIVGFQVDGTTLMEPDHISIELEFLGHLSDEEAKAWESGEVTKALDLLRYQNDFLNRHLGQWAFDFLDRVVHASRTDFYREVARLTSAFLEEQRLALPSMIEETRTRQAKTQ